MLLLLQVFPSSPVYLLRLSNGVNEMAIVDWKKGSVIRPAERNLGRIK
jgi:hypothetical protein